MEKSAKTHKDLPQYRFHKVQNVASHRKRYDAYEPDGCIYDRGLYDHCDHGCVQFCVDFPKCFNDRPTHSKQSEGENDGNKDVQARRQSPVG